MPTITLPPDLYYDPLLCFVLTVVLALFAFSIFVALYQTVKPIEDGIVHAENFVYTTTVLAGLVLSVAGGILGQPAALRAPALNPVASATPQPPSRTRPLQATPPERPMTTSNLEPKDHQKQMFATIYAFTYLGLGTCALVLFTKAGKGKKPTIAGATDGVPPVVKNLALTTLGLFVGILGRTF